MKKKYKIISFVTLLLFLLSAALNEVPTQAQVIDGFEDVDETNLDTNDGVTALNFGAAHGPVDIDPQASGDSASFAVIDQVVEGLFAYNLNDPKMGILPNLALDYGIWSGNNYTVDLKPNIYFHDGTLFDAYAVKFTFDRLNYFIENDMASAADLYKYYDVQASEIRNIINRTEIVNDNRIRFVLNQKVGTFEALLCFEGSYIVSPFSTPATERIDISTGTLVGTGPFVYDNYEDHVEVNFHAFENYWKGAPNITNLKFSIIIDATTRNNALLSGGVDIITNPMVSMLSTFELDPDIILVNAGQASTINYLGMNNYWINTTFRKAISHALNYSYIIEELLEGQAVRLKSPVPEGITYANWSYDVALFNRTKARTYMQSMGYGVGFTTDAEWQAATFATFNYTYNIGNQIRENMYPVLVDNLGYIGIKVEDAGTTWPQFILSLYELAGLHRDLVQLYWLGWFPDYNDASNYINPLFTNRSVASNGAKYNGYLSAIEAGRDPLALMDNVQLLMEAALLETDSNLRQTYYNRIQQLLVEEDMPLAFGCVPLAYFAYNKEISGFQWNPMGKVSFYEVIGRDSDIPSPPTTDNTIYIDGASTGIGAQNWTWAATQDWCSGSGTLEDPYVIEDLIIDGNGDTNGIEIHNSEKYFIIENCTLQNCGTYIDYIDAAGINLFNVKNGLIIHNKLSLNYYAVAFEQSQNISISENIFDDNFYGIASKSNNLDIIINSNTLKYNYYGLAIQYDCNNHTINSNIVEYSSLGIGLGGKNHKLSNNTLINCGFALMGQTIDELSTYSLDTSNTVNSKPVYYYANQSNLIPDNFIEPGQIILVNCNDSIISNVEISYTTFGIALHGCSDVVISDCSVTNSIGYGIYVYESDFNQITNCELNSNQHYGLFLYYSDNNSVIGNKLTLNNYGIGIFGHNNSVFQNELISNNLYGVVADWGAEENIIFGNFFIGNGINAEDHGLNNQWDNESIGNFWHDYTGIDSNHDGIGDSAYNIFSEGIDKFPIWDYIPISPFVIDEQGTGDYTWSEAALETWCSGAGTESDPYIIENLIIDGMSTESCIEIWYSDKNFIIRDCIFRNSGDNNDAGIWLFEVSNGEFSNNIFDSNYHGIFLDFQCYYNNISGNIVVNQRQDGIDLEAFCSFNTITDNIVVNNNQHGIVLRQDCDFNLISNNVANGHIYSGIMIQGGSNDNNIISNIANNNPLWGIWIYNSDSNNFEANQVAYNGEHGILITESDSNIVQTNLIYENQGDGISFESYDMNQCSNNIIVDNIIRKNLGRGIYLDDYSHDNQINLNQISDNKFQAVDDGFNNNWDNGTIGNYWDDYIGVDANDDGIGDTPYLIEGEPGSVDNYPIWDDGPTVDDVEPSIVINYYDEYALFGTGAVFIEAFITDNYQLELPITIEFYYPNGTLINNYDMILNISGSSDTFFYYWSVASLPILDNYYFIIYAYDTSNNLGLASESFNIVLEAPTPDYWILSPFIIDDDGYGDYTWAEAANQEWCSGSGTETNPYVIENAFIDGQSMDYCLWIRNSDVHFILRNCTFFNSHEGLKLNNLLNGIVEEGSFSKNNGNGISLIDCNNIIISNNFLNENGLSGLSLYNTNNSIFSDNLMNRNFQAGISAYESNDNIFLRNILKYNDLFGIYVHGKSNQFSENLMYGTGFIIWPDTMAFYSTENIPSNNLLDDKPIYFYNDMVGLGSEDFINAAQILLYNCNDSLITNLALVNGTIGVFMVNCYNNIIESNTISQSFFGIFLVQCNYITINYNNIIDNFQRGISLDRSNFTSIIDNNIENNTGSGITIYGSSDGVISENTIAFNMRSIYLDSTNYLIYLNSFIQNDNHAADYGSSNNWDNGTIGNYWDDYSGVDANDDGIGDEPYYIEGEAGSVDNYPIWDDGPTVDDVEPSIVINYYDEYALFGTGAFFIEAFITDNYQLELPITIEFYYPNGTLINTYDMIWDIGDTFFYNWSVDSFPALDDYYFIIYAYDTSNNLGVASESFNIVIETPTPDYWILSPFTIDETGYGDYTWEQVVNEEWCSGSGTLNDPYIIKNLIINGQGSDYCLSIRFSEEYFVIENCTFYNTYNLNYGGGLFFINTSNGKVFNNNCSDNYFAGIYLWNSHNFLISGNLVSSSSSYGIKIEYLSSNNVIYNNTFIENDINAFDDVGLNFWDNGVIGNYWDDYSGVDANDDGIGDAPYYIEGEAGSQDNYPIWDDGPTVDDVEPSIVINYYDEYALFGTGAIFLEAFITDNYQLELPITIEFYYPNGTLINSYDMILNISDSSDTFFYYWIVDSFPALEDYYFIIYAYDTSNNLGLASESFNIVIEIPTPDYWILSPFIIDDDGYGDYTWYEASLEDWCKGSGTQNDPYIIENVVIYGDSDTNGLEIRNSDNYFIIQNCTINDSGTSWNYGGIVLTNVLNGQIVDNSLISNFNNIWLRNSQFINISGNTVNGNAYGIKLQSSDYNNIINNYVENCHDAIVIEGISNLVSENTLVNNNQAGISISGFQNIITGNILENCGILTVETTHIIDVSNLVNGKPVYYYVDQIGLRPNDFLNAGQVILANCQDSIISDLTLTDVTRGINLINCNNITIKNCIISDNNLQGILLRNSSGNIITDNTFIRNGDDGILLSRSCHGNTIAGNVFIGGGIWSYDGCDNNIIFDNYFEDDGIDFSSGDFNIIINNEFKDVYYALKLSHGSNNIFYGNIIRDCNNPNPIATIFLRYTSYDNLLYNNSFINNLMNAYDDGVNNQWSNGTIGNYWDDYSGVDANDDGIGDTPYLIPGSAGSIDNFPIWDDGQDDFNPPITSLVYEGILGNDNWYISNILITLTATDDASGVAYTEYSFNNINWETFYNSFNISAEGIVNMYYRSVDNIGHIENTQMITFNIDITDPVSTISLDGIEGLNDWFTSDVTIFFEIIETGSGLSFTEYSYDGITWKLYTTPLIEVNEGITEVHYRSIDVAGNVENITTILFKIDKSNPITTVELFGSSGLNDWYISDVSVVLNLFDGASGVLMTRYSFDSIDWHVFSEPFNITIEGEITLYYQSMDEAGNWEDIKTTSLKIDKSTPITSIISLSGTLGSNGWYVSDVYATISATDANSGLSFTEYSFDGITWYTYSSPVDVFEEGLIEIYFKSTDLAGNEEIAKTQIIQIDKTAPLTTVNIEGNLVYEDWYDSNALITLSAEDIISGVSTIQYSFDGINWLSYTEPFNTPNMGELTLYYRSTDLAGNIETTKSITIKTIEFPIIIESFVSDLYDRLAEIQELMSDPIPNQALLDLEQAEHMLLLAIDHAKNGLLESSFYKLTEVVRNLLDAETYGVSTSSIIESLMSNIDDVTYLKIIEAESLLLGESNRHLGKAWVYYTKAQDLWNDGNLQSAINYYAKTIGKVNDALK